MEIDVDIQAEYARLLETGKDAEVPKNFFLAGQNYQQAAKKGEEIISLLDSDTLVLEDQDQKREDYSIKIESYNRKALENYQQATAEGNKEAELALEQLRKDLVTNK